MTATDALAIVDARDAYTGGHSRRVHELSMAIGEELGLEIEELRTLSEAALFHDVGKVAVPDEILLKPARLTAYEWELMRSHSDEGARIVSEAGVPETAVEAIRHHHEHYDGSGYPRGLEGEDTPLPARIIHVADAVDSMLTTRVYRPGRPARDAMREVRSEAGSQFCPSCVAALERLVAAGVLADVGIHRSASLAPVPVTQS